LGGVLSSGDRPSVTEPSAPCGVPTKATASGSMVDYYSVLARAVLKTADDPAARKELYERARRFVVAELRKQNPQISAQAIRREQAALEAAVRRIEAEIPQTTANEKTGRQGSPDSEVAEVDLRDMPKELAAMLFGTAYLAGIIAFSGVIYLQGLALVYANIIPYPLLLGATAALVYLLVLLSRTVFRKLRMYSHGVVRPKP
jgi:hypothetical protein